MAFLRMSGLALAVLLGLSLPIGQAKAMPANGLAATIPKNVENVAWVCGPYRCWSTAWGWRRPYEYWDWRRPLYAYAGRTWAGVDPIGVGADTLCIRRTRMGLASTLLGLAQTTLCICRTRLGLAATLLGLAPSTLRLRRTRLGIAPSALCVCRRHAVLGLA
jgi:hypothetical protein